MADYTNRQLAQVIAGMSKELQEVAVKNQRAVNQFNSVSEHLNHTLRGIDSRIENLKNYRPDLTEMDNYYLEKTAKNVEEINKRLKVPNFNLYLFIGSLVLLLISSAFFAYSMKSKRDIINEYQSELRKESIIVPREQNQLFQDMDKWFMSNPKARENFINWRSKKAK